MTLAWLNAPSCGKVAAMALGLAGIATAGAPALAETGRSVVIVLDASGSMNTRLPEGPTRMEAAKAAVTDLAGKLAPDARVALRVYGHQSSPQQKNCKDSALVVPFGPAAGNKAAIVEQVRGVTARGYTPINYSLQLAAKDLAGEASAERVVLLVSDGKETCEGDPCATAKALTDADAKLAVHVVGFGVDEVTRSQLMCIARNARGSYFDAASAGQLASVLGKAAAAKPAPTTTTAISLRMGKLKLEGGTKDLHDIFNAEGKQVGRFFQFGTEVELPAGIYSMQITSGPWTGIEVKSGETTTLKPGRIELGSFDSVAIGNNADLIEPETGKEISRFDPYSRAVITVIPGRYDIKFGEMLLPGGVEARPGEKTTISLGVLAIQGPSGMYFKVRDLQGRQAVRSYTVSSRQAVALPPATYELELELDALPEAQRKMRIEVKAGEKLEIKLN
jgi:hypothetical protein